MKTDGEKGTLISAGDRPEGRQAYQTTETTGADAHLTEANNRSGALEPEQLLGGRFLVKELVQSGGMGDVYLAMDLTNQQSVAIKTLRVGGASPERFEREAKRLSELKHPGIPRYITHDLASAGVPYLVMEWLEGVDLGTHLRRKRLGAATAVALTKHIAGAVATAHRQGIVHRDLNPSNLFLVGPDAADVRVLDFGVARLEGGDMPLTAEGAQIGTPGYMAPEQVEGRRDVGPEADIFSLGCVLYEMVAGQRAFHAPTIRELLARLVGDEPPSPRELNPQIPVELEHLILRMLAKDPRARPSNATELLHLLDALPSLDDVVPSAVLPSRSESTEQQVTSLIVLRADEDGVFERASRAAEPHGMRARRGTDGTIVIATSGAGTAGDHATRAARCALAVQRATRAHQIAMSTGLSQQAGEALSGRAFDSALVSLLMKDGRASEDRSQGPCLWIDENTASLLDSRFEVRAVEEGFLLRGMRETYEPTRTVLGRKTRCVGRRRELSMLEATLAESFEDGVASSVLVTGPPGIGKSRLASEIIRTARRSIPGLQVVRGGAESMTAGAPFGALSEAIERLCRIRENEPDSLRRTKLHDHLRPLVAPEDFQRVAEFLGELLGISTDRAPSAQLEAARRDAVLRGDQIVRALEDWLRAECKANPVLLVLDDFHWGDLATVKFFDAALRNMGECRMVVLALARPEIHEIFAKLWVKRGVTEVRLSGLSRRAASEMIEEVLGVDTPPAVYERIISRAQGNPFWIEELLRAEDAGQGENVPDRVVLLAQSRIEQQSPDERRLLKAASIFGGQFWLGGAGAVLGPQSTNRLLDTVLTELVENEFVVEHELSRIGGEREYQFASGLLRDAAYSLLGEEEKEQGHLRAADWLEKNGDADPLAVALHFALGGEPDRARPHYLAAAEQALSADDLEGAVACAEEGLSAGARGRDAIRLHLVHAEANKWRGDNAMAFRSAQAAFARAEEGTPEWYRAAAEAAVAAGKTAKEESSLAIAKELLASTPQDAARADHGSALSRVATQLVFMNKLDLARELLDAVPGRGQRVQPDPHVMGFFNEARAVLAGASDDPVGRITFAERAVEHFEDAGDLRNACLGRLSQGYAEVEFGAVEDAVVTLTRGLETAERMGLSNSIPVARAQLGRALSRLGHSDDACAHLEAAAHAFDRQKNLRLSGMTRVYLAEYYLLSGQPEAAFESARRAAAILEPMPPLLRVAQALKAAICTLPDVAATPKDAKRWADQALDELRDQRLPVGESIVRLGAACGYYLSGETKLAQAIVSAEAARVQDLASAMTKERATQFLSGDPARALLTINSSQLTSPADRFDYARWLMSAQTTNDSQAALKSQDRSTQADVARIVTEEDPVLRNLWITQSYHQLSTEISRTVDQGNVNWSTFACWASKTAGISLRNDEVSEFVRKELGLDQGRLPGVTGFSEKLLHSLRLTGFVREAALSTLREVTREIAAGNRKVYAELAPLLARFVDLMRTEPGEPQVDEFLETLRSGTIEEGGQELLKRAFRAWFEASRTSSDAARAQLILRANCQIGLHEQARLQPHIQGAMGAPIGAILHRNVRSRLPMLVAPPLAWLVRILARPFIAQLARLWERIATRYSMNLALPGGNEISLGEDPPEFAHRFPSDLSPITDPKTEAFLERFDNKLGSTKGSGANNWADLNDRMGFIVELFRSRQQELVLFEAPYTSAQEAELAAGRVPQADL